MVAQIITGQLQTEPTGTREQRNLLRNYIPVRTVRCDVGEEVGKVDGVWLECLASHQRITCDRHDRHPDICPNVNVGPSAVTKELRKKLVRSISKPAFLRISEQNVRIAGRTLHYAVVAIDLKRDDMRVNCQAAEQAKAATAAAVVRSKDKASSSSSVS